MRRLRYPIENEKGASAVMIALSLVVLMGIAAVAIDVGAGFNQRRQDQTAADVGVMAGAIEAPGSSAAIRNQILDFAERNVIVERTPAEWQAEWSTCVDPELAALNASGHHFVPVPAPAGWGVATINCISIDQSGFVRVRLPNLEFATTFGRVIGVDELSTQADAIATITSGGGGGILPFGLLATAGGGQHVCLETAPGGHAEPPCTGPASGNFGVIISPQYGNPVVGTTQRCGGNKHTLLTINIAVGIDHLVWVDADGLAANQILDTCGNMDAGLTPDTLDTQTGNADVIEGLVTGPIPNPPGGLPRLQQGANSKANVHTYDLDNRPLWDYIDPFLSTTSATPDDLPANCERSTFNNTTHPDFDWDGDGTLDRPESWQHLGKCLADYVSGGHTAILFLDEVEDDDLDGRVITISKSPRFTYVPQFWESTWPNGTSAPRHIKRFRAVWLQATWWKKGNTVQVFHPGEGGNFSQSGNWKMEQLSAMVIPDNALPQSLRGDPPPGGGVNPFEAQLYR